MKDIFGKVQKDLDRAKKAFDAGDEAKSRRIVKRVNKTLQREIDKIDRKRLVKESITIPKSLLADLISVGDKKNDVISESCGCQHGGEWKKLKDALSSQKKRVGSGYSEIKPKKDSIFK